MKKNVIGKSIMGVLLGISMLVAAGCGKSAGTIPDEAASRSKDETSQYTYIDDEAIAKAASTTPSADTQAMIDETIALVNEERAAEGLSALSDNQGLEQCAQVRATECATSFSHTRPDGSDWWTVNSDLMYGENLAENYDSAQAVVDAWMASPAHKENIMTADFQTVGIATYTDESGNLYWAQEFGY